MTPTYATGIEIALGDWVRVFLPRKGVWHHGIVRQIYWAGNGFAVEIANNAKGFGITASDWYQFADGQNVLLHRRASTAAQVAEILARVENSLGKPYHLFAHNCEHFASFAFSGKAESHTVRTVGLVAALAAVVIGLLASE
jgi:hypothetical protein